MSEVTNTHENGPQRPELENAIAYMSDHLSEKIYLRDLCRAAGVSPRALGYMFVKAFGETPMAHLKRRRMEQARDLLMQPGSSEATVTDIARQCGFKHMGQFALDYRKAMGERPSETLNRCPDA